MVIFIYYSFLKSFYSGIALIESKSIDLYAKGYKNLECITVDPIRGWAYVCAWTGHPSYALVIDKNILKAAIPIHFLAELSFLAVDTKHDYVTDVAHYDPAVMSVLCETKLITTVDTLGYGTMDVVVGGREYSIHVSDDGSVMVFGFKRSGKRIFVVKYPEPICPKVIVYQHRTNSYKYRN